MSLDDQFLLYWLFRYDYRVVFACAFAALIVIAYMFKSWRLFTAGFLILSLLLGLRFMFGSNLLESAIHNLSLRG
jgi:hypothetical protein